MAERTSIAECRMLLASADLDDLPRLIRRYRRDPRKGVADILAAASRRLKRARTEDARLRGLADMQAALHEQGIEVVAGVDEVGRGAYAGPLTAAAVVLPVDAVIPGLDDSKKLTPEKRTLLAVEIREVATAWCVSHASPEEIDHFGMTQAVRLAMRRALDGLGVAIGHVLVDGIDGNVGYPATPVVDGDAKCACIAAASIIAKVTRDALMVDLDASYPGYGFAEHKGYGTAEHQRAIRALGPSAAHRLSFAPCSDDPSLF